MSEDDDVRTRAAIRDVDVGGHGMVAAVECTIESFCPYMTVTANSNEYGIRRVALLSGITFVRIPGCLTTLVSK